MFAACTYVCRCVHVNNVCTHTHTPDWLFNIVDCSVVLYVVQVFEVLYEESEMFVELNSALFSAGKVMYM